MLNGKDFINKSTKTLSEFKINDKLNEFDLYKLAQLNEIKIEMRKGWMNLVIDLVIELDQDGWNRKVSSIKEKYGELRFYATTLNESILEKYTEKSKTICEVCGNPGQLLDQKGWYSTRCKDHNDQ